MAAEVSPPAPRGLRDHVGSVRVRTTFAAVSVVGIALVGASIALVAILGDSLTESAEEGTRARAEEVASALASSEGARGPLETREDDEVIQVIDGDGTVLAWSRNAIGRPSIASVGPGEWTRVRVPWDQGVDYLATATAADLKGGGATVIVARPLDDVVDSTRIVSNILVVGIPLLLIVVAITTWRVVGRALYPVDAIRREVDAISASELHRRVTEPAGRDEIARLAATMNVMLDRLEGSQLRQRRFVSDASHELRSPVASIRQHAEVALAHPDLVTVGELAETVLAEDLRVQGLVDDLLLLARADERSLVVAAATVDLDDLVLEEARRVAATTRLTVDQSGISAGRVRGDPVQLQRLTRNLLENAVRHAQAGIAISVRDQGGFVVLRVDDDGAGIPIGEQGRVFERFVRLDDGRGRDEGGSGLGLAIVAEIVAGHAGSISISDAPGGGARFEVRLPGLAD